MCEEVLKFTAEGIDHSIPLSSLPLLCPKTWNEIITEEADNNGIHAYIECAPGNELVFFFRRRLTSDYGCNARKEFFCRLKLNNEYTKLCGKFATHTFG